MFRLKDTVGRLELDVYDPYYIYYICTYTTCIDFKILWVDYN